MLNRRGALKALGSALVTAVLNWSRQPRQLGRIACRAPGDATRWRAALEILERA